MVSWHQGCSFHLVNKSLVNEILDILDNMTRIIRTYVIWPHLAQAAVENNCVR